MIDETVPAKTNIEIMRVETPTQDVRALLEELDRELSANYAPEQRHGLTIEAIFQPGVRFFLARLNGQAVGCGGVAVFDQFAEVKRMFVRKEARGRGVAEAMLGRLEAEARSAGLTILRLETGTQQLAAIRFYTRSGFHPCEAFEPYAAMPAEAIKESVFLEKRLA